MGKVKQIEHPFVGQKRVAVPFATAFPPAHVRALTGLYQLHNSALFQRTTAIAARQRFGLSLLSWANFTPKSTTVDTHAVHWLQVFLTNPLALSSFLAYGHHTANLNNPPGRI